jgi:putative transcriptional regulator
MKKHPKLGKDNPKLWAPSLRELKGFMEGKPSKYWHRVQYPKPVDKVEVKEVRRSLKLTQLAFAQALGMSLSTIRSWEQGTKKPDGLARKVLRTLMQTPDLLQDLAKA